MPKTCARSGLVYHNLQFTELGSSDQNLFPSKAAVIFKTFDFAKRGTYTTWIVAAIARLIAQNRPQKTSGSHIMVRTTHNRLTDWVGSDISDKKEAYFSFSLTLWAPNQTKDFLSGSANYLIQFSLYSWHALRPNGQIIPLIAC